MIYSSNAKFCRESFYLGGSLGLLECGWRMQCHTSHVTRIIRVPWHEYLSISSSYEIEKTKSMIISTHTCIYIYWCHQLSMIYVYNSLLNKRFLPFQQSLRNVTPLEAKLHLQVWPWDIFLLPLQEVNTLPTKREVRNIIIFNSAGDGIGDMWSFGKGNVKLTSKMERLPILREDDKVVWNWWCIVWFIGHCHGNKTYQFFKSRSTLCFIFQTISLKITSVPWLEQCGQSVYAETTYDSLSMDSTQIHIWSPQDSPERFLQLIWRWRVT